MFDVLVVGDLNPDLILSGDIVPKFGQVEKLLDDAELTIGGSSAIFACGAARLGLRVAFVGKVGDDEFGQYMRRALAARGVDTRGVVVDAAIKTGLTVILSHQKDRALLTFSGSLGALHAGDIDRSLLNQARHLHMGSYFMLDSLRPDVPALFDAAKAASMTISLDTNYDPLEQWDGGLHETLQRVDVFLPNETELRGIAGLPETGEALEALSRRVPLVVVKRGADGALAQRGQEVVQAESLPVTPVDATGAGDSFDAGFIYGYLNGWELARSLRLACVCGALSTRAAGGTAGQPMLEEAVAKLQGR